MINFHTVKISVMHARKKMFNVFDLKHGIYFTPATQLLNIFTRENYKV